VGAHGAREREPGQEEAVRQVGREEGREEGREGGRKEHKKEIYTIRWAPTGPGSENPGKRKLFAR